MKKRVRGKCNYERKTQRDAVLFALKMKEDKLRRWVASRR